MRRRVLGPYLRSERVRRDRTSGCRQEHFDEHANEARARGDPVEAHDAAVTRQTQMAELDADDTRRSGSSSALRPSLACRRRGDLGDLISHLSSWLQTSCRPREPPDPPKLPKTTTEPTALRTSDHQPLIIPITRQSQNPRAKPRGDLQIGRVPLVRPRVFGRALAHVMRTRGAGGKSLARGLRWKDAGSAHRCAARLRGSRVRCSVDSGADGPKATSGPVDGAADPAPDGGSDGGAAPAVPQCTGVMTPCNIAPDSHDTEGRASP
jgi:hypothetical protein